MPVRRATLLACVFVLVFAVRAFAQFETGAVLGQIRDDTGAVVPGAAVTLLNVETGVAIERVTDTEGGYEFFTVRPGTYKVSAALAGFATTFADNVQVSVGNRQRVDLTMKVGSLAEAVEVVGGVKTLETDTSQRGQVVSGRQATELPLNGREYSALAQLSPGVRLSALNTGGLTPREGSFNVNGLRSTFNNFLIDGVDNNAYGTSNQGFSNQVMQPPPDSLVEFRVVTNNVSAEYGRSGGATLNVAYKSGTNRFSGAAWEFFRDTSMNAEGFFKSATGKPELKRNQYGYVLGGPILRNRAFFFTDYEGFRQNRERRHDLHHPDRSPAPGNPGRGHPQPADRCGLPGRHAGPDDGVGAQGARRAAGDDEPRRREQLPHAAALRERDRQGERQGGSSRSRRASRPSAASATATWTSSTTRRCRCRRAGVATARPTSPTSSSRWAPRGRPRRRRSSRCGSAGRAPRPARTRRRSAARARSTPTASPACRPIRAWRAACRPRPSPATPTSGARPPTRSGSTRRCSTPR